MTNAAAIPVLDMATLARMAALPPEARRQVIAALGPEGVREAIRVYQASQQAMNGLGKSFFSKIGDFLSDAAKTVIGTVKGVLSPQPAAPVVIQQPAPAPVPAQAELPPWVLPVAIGGGAILLIMLLRK